MTDIISRSAELPQRIKTGYGEMKLRTVMVAPDSTSSSWYPVGDDDEYGHPLLHDAASAHALIRSMCEHFGVTSIRDLGISKRASEIMREWGWEE